MRTLPLLAATAVFGLAAATASAAPAEFLHKAIQGDNSEMRLGQLAAQRGGSAAVKAYGKTLEQDHRTAKIQASAVARAHGISVSTDVMPEAAAEYAKLQHLQGAAFDHEFASYMTQDHEKDIADFQKEADSSDPAYVRNLARKTIPTLRKHLQMARSIG